MYNSDNSGNSADSKRTGTGWTRRIAAIAAVAGGLVGAATAVGAAGSPLTITRANLANAATFTVTRVLAPKGSAKTVSTFKVEVKGQKGRVDFSDPSFGQARYVANEKGVFLYTPGNGSALKQDLKGGVEMALQQAFAQMTGKMERAKKVGTATVSGQPTDVYRDASTGATIYVGTRPGFRLPVKIEQVNAGGATSTLVTDIRLNPSLPDSEFALPKGTQVIDGASPSPGGVR